MKKFFTDIRKLLFICSILFFLLLLVNMWGLSFTLQLIIYGILLGGLYSLIAIGLTIIFGVMRVINFAHGELLMIGGYFTYYLFHLFHIDPILSLVGTIPLLFLVGLALQKTLFHKPELLTETTSLILTFGLSIFISNMALNIFSADFRSIPYLDISVKIYNIYLPASRLIAFALSMLLSLVVLLYLTKGKWGVGLRATSQNVAVAQSCGINVNYVRLITMGIGCSLAGASGSIMTIIFSLCPTMGLPYAIKAFVIIIIGGMGSILGAFCGGILLGIVDTIGAYIFGSILSELLAYLLLITVLLIKPEGIGGK